MSAQRVSIFNGYGRPVKDMSVNEAMVESGLAWDVSLCNLYAKNGETMAKVPNKFGIVREDNDDVIGVVGKNYMVYQNYEMWNFIDWFKNKSNCVLDVAGEAKGGAITWVAAKNGEMEWIKGDPVKEYFLFRNSYDGSSPIMVLFTNIRVCCQNALVAAVNEAENVFRVRHTANSEEQLKQIEAALNVRFSYQQNQSLIMKELAKRQMTESVMRDWLLANLFVEKVVNQEVGEDDLVLESGSSRAESIRQNNVNAVMELVESGAGTEISGVRGNAYGFYQAITEWADHEKQSKGGQEERFLSMFYGTIALFKQQALRQLMKN